MQKLSIFQESVSINKFAKIDANKSFLTDNWYIFNFYPIEALT